MAGSGVPAGWRLEDEPQARESARESSARRTGNTVPEGWKLAPVNEQILVAPKPEPEGWLDRTLRSGKATLTTAKRGWDGLAGGLARGTAVAADTIGFDSLADIARRDAAELEAMAATPVVGARSWADVKRDPLGNIIPFVTEQGLGGVPDMAMAVASLPVYAGLRASSMGQDRAVNNGRADATLLDVLKAAPAAVGSAALERFGTRGILGDVAGEGLQAVGRAGVREGITEGLQSPLEYAGTNVGTNAGFDPMVAAELAAQGIVVGAPFGAAANAGVQMVTPGAVTDPEPDLIDGSLDGAVDPLTAARQEFDAFQAESAPLRGQNPVVDMALNNKAAELEANMRRAFAETRAAPQPQTNSPAISDDVSIIAAPEGAVRSDDAGGIAGLLRQRVADSDVLDRARERAADNPTLAAILDSSANTQQQVKTLWDRLGEIDRAGERGPFPDIDMSDVNIPRDAAGQVRSLPDAAPARARVNAAPSNDGVGVIKELFPNARVTSGYRGPDHPLSKKNPNSYHAKSRGAVDMAPIEGITFEQAKARIQDAGYPIIEGINEVGKGRTKNATGDHWHFVVGERNGNAPAVTDRAPTPLRVADEDELRRRRDDPPMFDDKNAGYRGFENTDAPESATNRQRIEGNEYTSPTQTGDSSKAFPETPDDPAGNPRYWEDRANMQADDLRSAWEERMREDAAGANARKESAGAGIGPDPANRWKNKYDQKPAKDADFWKFTDDGFVAGASSSPVAFRSAKEAAKWAAANKMGGDLEPVVWATNGKRIVLRRRDGSTYGQAAPDAAPDAAAAPTGNFTRTEFERTPPPAGRSTDESQRAIGGEPETAPEMPLQGQQPQSAPAAPKTPKAPYTAPRSDNGGASSNGLREEVVTSDGIKLDTEFEVVEAADLITSDNPSFDQRFQPRDRAGRSASDAQIADIASKLDPEQLSSSRLASQGAPIVAPDGMVESGNGRTSAIRRAYDQNPERADGYRKMIERKGFDTTGMKQPVLIRRRKTEMDDNQRAAFARSAQGGGTMDMAVTEKAKADAKALPADTMKLYRGGDINSAANRDFVRSFKDKVVPKDEHGAMELTDGSLSGPGVDRIRGAMASKAYDNPKLVEKLTVDPDTEIKAIGNVLVDLAPAFAQLKNRIADGDLPAAFDITPQIAEMATLVARSRREKIPLIDLIDQSDIFSGDINPITEALAGVMAKGEGLATARSAKDIADGLNFYLKDVEVSGADMFGGDLTSRALEVVQAAREMLRQRDLGKIDTTGNLFGERPARPGVGPVSRERIKSLPGELRKVEGRLSELAAKLADVVGDDATARYGIDGLQNKRNIGEAEPETGRAFVRDEGDIETLVHEAIHVAAVARYGYAFDNMRPGDLANAPVRELLTLFNDAREVAGRGLGLNSSIKYALSDPHEFLSMALTNRSVQRWLDRGSLWNRFTDGVRKLLGFEPKFKSMLGDVMRAGTAIVDAAKVDPIRLRETGSRLASPGKPSFLDSILDTDGLKRDAAAVKAAIGSPIETAKSLGGSMGNSISAALFSNDARLRAIGKKFNSDAIIELADDFHARSGKDDATGRTYHEAVARRSSGQMQQVFDALSTFLEKPASLQRIRDLLATPNKKVPATAAERDAAKTVAGLLKEEIAYRKAAGEDIGQVTDGYFPRIMDVEKAVRGRDKWLVKAEQLYRGTGMSGKEAKGAAQAWFERVFDQYAGIDGGLDFLSGGKGSVGGTGTQTSKAREFGKAADSLMADFYSDDVMGTLSAYFAGSARRAEFTRRFGKDGLEGSKERADWETLHDGKTKLEVLEDRIKTDLRGSDVDAEGVLGVVNDVVASNLGRSGANIRGRTRNGIAYLHAWNQLAKLDRTTVTSLTELAMGFVRGGDLRRGFSYVGSSLYQFGRQVAKAAPDDAQRWSEALGIGQDAMVNQMLLSRAGIDLTTGGTQKVMAGFYRGIGLHQFTEGTRIASVQMGRKYVDVLAGDMVSKNKRVASRAAYYLRELGVSDPAKFADGVRNGGPSLGDVRADKDGMASEYATALIRFTDQTIMMPNRAVKPTLASHPVGSLFYSLLSWSFGFKKNVIDRTGRLAWQGAKTKDPKYLAPAAGMVMLALWSDFVDSEIRPAIFGTTYDFDGETPTEHALRVADRAGFTGAMSPLVNAVRGIKYDRSLAESFSGPVVGTLLGAAGKIATLGSERNTKNNSAERNAATAVYEVAVEPALDAFAAARLKSVVRTAGILATGNKEGGLLPGDKDWFVDTVAGEKKK